MRIRILQQTSIAGRVVRPGDEIEASESDGRTLRAMGKAELLPDVEPLPAIETPTVERRKPRTRKG